MAANHATTKEDIERLWRDYTTVTFTLEDNKALHEYKAGSISVFHCDEECEQIMFVQGDQILLSKRGPGHIATVPADVSIVAQYGSTKGS
ncbi:hypothetical protein QQX98_007127 [Neonectria punicea]|uniref:AraC family transcriptional regulator n=1 Tax=Neonectria punicea TaxID=979145 RepID=A0ABR1H062_9HYPO